MSIDEGGSKTHTEDLPFKNKIDHKVRTGNEAWMHVVCASEDINI